MSTRCTISYDDNFHLYQECFESDNVYLTLDGEGWQAGITTASVDWRRGESTTPSLSLQIDVTLWRKLVEGWLASHWGQCPEDDHKKMDFDPDTTLKWLEEYKRNKEDGNTE